MQPFVPPKLMPWIEFGNNTVYLKQDAPEEVKPLYEKLKSNMEKLNKETFKGLK
jgi:hypothetical protein